MAEVATILDMDTGETIEGDGIRMVELPDGSTEVDLNPGEDDVASAVVDEENLAEKLSASDASRIAMDIIEQVELDKQSRAGWLDKIKNGLERCAIIGDGVVAGVEGGAMVVHPLVGEAAVQFQARAMEEVFPAAGPVKTQVIGQTSRELNKRAERVEGHMNWQMLEEDEGYYADSDQLLFVLALMGSQFRRTYWNSRLKQISSERADPEFLIVPYTAKSLLDAPRITYEMYVDQIDMEEYQATGFYLSADKVALQQPSETGVSEIVQKADSSTESVDEEKDTRHKLYETITRLKLPKTDDFDEYIVTVSVEDQKLLAIRRNKITVRGVERRREHWTHWKYLPGLGFYGTGLLYWLGSLNDAATGALRGQLDAAQAANFQGGFATRELKALGQEISVKFGKWKVVDVTSEDLAKGFYTPPFREPTPALTQLFEILVQTGQRFGSTTEAMVGEGSQNVPVGTTIARIEQATKVYSGIHKRCHRALMHEIRLRTLLNRERLEEQSEFVLNGKSLIIYPEDYSDDIDVLPVSDPNIVSTPQRIQIAEAQLQLAQRNPANFDMYEVEERYLQALKVPDIRAIHRRPDAVPMLDPISEGVRAMVGQAIKVYPEQDHQAHIMVHMQQMQSAVGSPVEQIAVPLLQSHIAQHMATAYRIQMGAMLGVEIPDPTAMKGDEESPVPPEIQDQIGMAAAQAAAKAQQEQEEKGPDPDSALKLAQAKKADAEAEEVIARVQSGDQDARALLEQAMQQMQEMQAALQEGIARDQKAEQDRLDMMATIDDLQQQIAQMGQQQGAAKGDAEKAIKDAIEIRRANIDADAKKEVAKAQAIAERDKEKLQRALDEQAKHIADLAKELAKLQKERESEAKAKATPAPAAAAQSAPLPPITVGPIIIEKGPGAARTIQIKANEDGSYTGTSEPEPDKKGK